MESQPEVPIGDGGDGGDGERRPPAAIPPRGALNLILYGAVVGAIAVLIGLGGLAPSSSRFCIPFLTCDRAPPSGPVTSTGRPAVTLSRISYDELLRAVKPYLPAYGPDGVAVIPGSRWLPRERRQPLKLIPSPDPIGETFLSFLGPQARPFFNRQLLNPADRTKLPYAAVGQLRGEVTCSAALISSHRLIITANHCLPWDTTAKGVWTAMEFTPAYDAAAPNPAPFGTATVNTCVGILDPNVNDGKGDDIADGRDVAVCWLDWPGAKIPAGLKYLGYAWADDDDVDNFYELGEWNAKGGSPEAWTSVGYPADVNNGNSPAVQAALSISNVGAPNDLGVLLTTGPYVDDGWSGGPLIGFNASNGGEPYVVGAVMAWVGPAGYGYLAANEALHVGGLRPAALALYLFNNPPPNLSQVNKSPH